jgi:hypothetical protein
VEEPPFLMAVQRIVGGVEVENDFPRCLAVCIEEHVDEHVLQGLVIAADLVIAGASVAGSELPRIAAVAEACRHPLDQPDRPVRLA